MQILSFHKTFMYVIVIENGKDTSDDSGNTWQWRGFLQEWDTYTYDSSPRQTGDASKDIEAIRKGIEMWNEKGACLND